MDKVWIPNEIYASILEQERIIQKGMAYGLRPYAWNSLEFLSCLSGLADLLAEDVVVPVKLVEHEYLGF